MDGRMYLGGHSAGSGHSPGSPPPPRPAHPPPPACLLAERHEAVLDDITLRFGEGAAPGQAVHGVQHGVHHDGAVLGSRKERRTLGDERQHRQAQVSVQRQRHFSSAEGGLGRRVGTSVLCGSWVALALALDTSEQMTQASDLSSKPAPPSLYSLTKVEKPINEPSLPRLNIHRVARLS